MSYRSHGGAPVRIDPSAPPSRSTNITGSRPAMSREGMIARTAFYDSQARTIDDDAQPVLPLNDRVPPPASDPRPDGRSGVVTKSLHNLMVRQGTGLVPDQTVSLVLTPLPAIALGMRR